MTTRSTYAAALAAGTLVLTVATGASYAAGPSHKDLEAKTIKVAVVDPKGDLTAETGPLADVGSGSTDRFENGTGTFITPTAADEAVDLTRVSYKITRTGRTPALKISYSVVGPLSPSLHQSKTATSASYVATGDMLWTGFGHGYSVDVTDSKAVFVSGLTDNRGKKVACHGLKTSITRGGTSASATVPLSCLAAIHVKALALTTRAERDTIDVEATTSSATQTITMVWDQASKTRVLPLTTK